MPNPQIFIACRDNSEAQRIRKVIGQPSIPAFHKSAPLLERLESAKNCMLITTPLMMDETAHGILTKSAILQNGYIILYACHGDRAINLLRLYGCGCSAILGPDELDMLPALLDTEKVHPDELVIPPFFIDDDESKLKEPPLQSAHPLHITFLGSQAIMSCANAMLNITASETMSMACVAPKQPWALSHLMKTMNDFTLWKAQMESTITQGYVSFCNDLNSLISLEPTEQHFVICHGRLDDNELSYIQHLPPNIRIFRASNQGYSEENSDELQPVMRPEKLWDIFITALYG